MSRRLQPVEPRNGVTYLDTSVVMRVVLRDDDALTHWRNLDRVVSSALTEVECLRTLDRLTHARSLDDDALAARRIAVYEILEATEVIDVSASILRRASQSLPTPLGTLDALHLATAMSWRDARGEAITFATHDRALSTAAKATGFAVVGV